MKALSKDTLEFLMNDGVKLTRFKDVLISVRLIIENVQNEGDYLQLSGDARDKALENIEELLTQSTVSDMLEELYKKEEEKNKLEKSIEEKGYLERIDELKEKIAVNTADLEHMTADYNRRKNEYSDLIQKIMQLRERLQQDIKRETKDNIKIKSKCVLNSMPHERKHNVLSYFFRNLILYFFKICNSAYPLISKDFTGKDRNPEQKYKTINFFMVSI